MNNSTPATTPAGAPMMNEAPRGNAHWWFTALDHRALAVGADRWLTQVVGVHVEGGEVWIQLQSLPEQLQDFTIRVGPGMTVDDVVTAVEAQIRNATGHPR